MIFGLDTAIAVRECEDGLLEKDTFDLSTAVPVENPKGMTISAPKEKLPYSPPLTDEQKAQAVVELGYRERGEKVPFGIKADWVLTSPTAKMISANVLVGILTQGVIPAYNALKGIANASSPNSDIGTMIFESAYKGLAENESIDNLGGAAAKAYPDAPWQITGAMGALAEVLMFMPSIVKGGAELLSKDKQFTMALNTARKSPKWGDLVTKVAEKSNQPVEVVDEALYRKLWDIRGESNYFKVLNYNLKNATGVDILSEAGAIPITRAKVGQSVNFTDPKGLIKSGVIKEITGERAIINLEGREIVATLSQLSLPEVKKPLTAQEAVKQGMSAEEWVASKGKPVYHGTNEEFESFELGRTTGAQGRTSKQGVWFTDSKEEAVQYAKLAGKRNYQNQKQYEKKIESLISKSEKAADRGDYDTQEKLLAEAESLEIEMKSIEPKEIVKEAILPKNMLKHDSVTLFNSDEMDNVIARAKKEGYDGVAFINISDSPFGLKEATNQYVVFDPKNIKTKSQLLAEYEKAKGEIKPIQEGKPLKSVLPTSQVKKTIRENTGQIKVSDIIREDEALKRMLQQEEKLSAKLTKEAKKTEKIMGEQAAKWFLKYEYEIDDLKEKIKIGEFNTEAEKVKAEYKLQELKQKYADAKEEQKQKQDLKDEVKNLVDSIEASPKESVAIEYQEAIDNIKSKFDFKNRQEETLLKREGMKAFVARMKQEGKTVNIPEEKLALLDKVTLKDMTLDHLREVADTIKSLEKLGKTKLKARIAVYEGQKARIKEELLKEVTPVNSKELPKTAVGESNNAWIERAIKIQNSVQKTRVGLTPIDGLAEVTGMTKMKKVLDADYSNYLTYNDEAIKEWYELTKDFTEREMDRIGVYAASRQEGGIERLANSGITEEEIKAIKLTPEEEKAYKFVLNTFNKEYPAIKQYSKEVYNADVGQQDNYVSFMADYDQMSELEMYERFAQNSEGFGRKTKTVEKGFTQARAGISKIKLETNIDKIFRRHMDDVAYMLNTGKNIKMYFEIVNSPEMREKLGDVGSLAWLQWLDLMARKGGMEGGRRLAALDILRKNIGAGVLAFRVSSALVQFSSFADTIATIGSEWATRGATSISTSPEWRSFILENFPEVKKAIGDDVAFREFGEGFLANMTRVGTKPLQILDGVMRSVAASGSYQKLMAEAGFELDLNNPNSDIIAEATRLMRQSQGSSFFKDQPLSATTGFGLSDNRSLNKTLLTFQSFMLNRWDNINRQIWRLGIKEKDYKKAISAVFWMFIFAGALEEGLRRGSRKIISTISGDKKKEEGFIQNIVLNDVQSVPLLGQIVSSLSYSSNPVPVLNAINDLFENASYAVKSKKPETKMKNTIATALSVGTLAGIPGSSQLSQIIKQSFSKNKKKKIKI